MYLETVTGKFINITDPTDEQIDIEDIAWGLSRVSRFAGQTITKVPYNVAQHSVLALKIVIKLLPQVGIQPNSPQGRKIQLMTLLHDAAEAYMGDIPSPVKKHPTIKEEFKNLEYGLLSKIYKKFRLDVPLEEERILIKQADMLALAIEAHAFMVSRGRHELWGELPSVSLVELQDFDEPMDSTSAYEYFMDCFKDLYYR